VSYVGIPGTRPTITNSQGSGYALTLGGYKTVNGIDVVSELEQESTINSVTLGGIDGSGNSVMAIVDTNVTVNLMGTGGAGGDGIVSGTEIGIDLSDADHLWLIDTTVTNGMIGIGGAGDSADGGTDGDGGSGDPWRQRYRHRHPDRDRPQRDRVCVADRHHPHE
jgi:hypothetical protein